MRFYTLASGSTGNCSLIVAGSGTDQVTVCLDCGIAQRTARQFAEAVGLALTSVDAVLLSHRHSDHSANIVPVAARARAPLYASEAALGTNTRTGWAELQRRNVEFRAIADRGSFQIGPLLITPVEVPHDADPTFGFIFEADGQRAAYFTDLGRTEVLQEAGLLDGIETLVLESNHDQQMLSRGPYPMALKERVGGNLGHLSNDQTSEFLAAAAPHGLKTLVLAHLSLKNNTPQLALAAAAQGLQQRGLSAVELVVAPARGPLRSAPQCK
jgi:phosphoribosyl 1,2-cyclic phosphodiesterase